jgi:hypothetical protein
MVERMNQTLTQTIAKLSLDAQNRSDQAVEWDMVVKDALLAIRTMPNKTTGYSAAKLLYGQELRTPSSWEPNGDEWIEGNDADEVEYRMNLIHDHLEVSRASALSRSEEEARRRKIRYDQTVYLRSHEAGSKVLLLMLEKAHKFAALWEGPYTVERSFPNGTYILSGYDHNPVHGDRLREYSNRDSLIPEVGSQRHAQNVVYQRWREPSRMV